MTDRAEVEVPQADLHAYVDGQLAPARRKAIEGWLGEHPMIAATVGGWQAQNAAIRALFDGDADAAQAAADWRRVRALRARVVRPRPRWVTGVVAGFLALGTLAGAASLLGRIEPPVQRDAMPPLAAASHDLWLVYAGDPQHPVEMGADRATELVAWLGKRLGAPIAAPDLSPLGLRLLGGRLVPFGAAAGALLIYEDGAGRRLGALMVQDPGDAADTDFRFAERDGIATLSWQDAGLGYALSAPVPRARLLELATAFQDRI